MTKLKPKHLLSNRDSDSKIYPDFTVYGPVKVFFSGEKVPTYKIIYRCYIPIERDNNKYIIPFMQCMEKSNEEFSLHELYLMKKRCIKECNSVIKNFKIPKDYSNLKTIYGIPLIYKV